QQIQVRRGVKVMIGIGGSARCHDECRVSDEPRPIRRYELSPEFARSSLDVVAKDSGPYPLDPQVEERSSILAPLNGLIFRLQPADGLGSAPVDRIHRESRVSAKANRLFPVRRDRAAIDTLRSYRSKASRGDVLYVRTHSMTRNPRVDQNSLPVRKERGI